MTARRNPVVRIERAVMRTENDLPVLFDLECANTMEMM